MLRHLHKKQCSPARNQLPLAAFIVSKAYVNGPQSVCALTVTHAVDLQDSEKSEAQRLLADAEALMAEIGSGDYKARQAKNAAETAKQAEAGLATQGLKLRCDVNGCVIVPINAQQSTPGLTGRFTLH